MLKKRWGKLSSIATLVGCTVALCTVMASCMTMQISEVAAPEIPGATFVGNDECAACHEAEAKAFPRSAHARVHVLDAGIEGASGCESCHGPGSLHIDGEGGKNIINPGKSSAACYRCHMEKQAEFSLPYAHPVEQGKMTCNDCHDPHGSDTKKPASIAIARANDGCRKCHREQSRPHMYEHEALRDGCVACHAVHGSLNKKMLTESDMSVCLKCHSQITAKPTSLDLGARDHASYSTRATCWSAGCHTAIHGSSVDSHLRY